MATQITRYNLSVKIETNDSRLIRHLETFLDRYYTVTQRGFGPNGQDSKRVYVSKLKNFNIWFMHNLQFAHFYHYLKDMNEKIDASFIDEREYKVAEEDYKVREGLTLHDDQVPVYDFIMVDPTKSKLVPLVTGSGKTVISLIALGHLKKRIGVIILSQFTDKWASDIIESHEAKGEDIMLVAGSKALNQVIEGAKTGEYNAKYYIFSSRTIQDYISLYEEDPDLCVDMYGCAPIDLFPTLGLGALLIDETHMAFHAIYKTVVHTNVVFQLGLSATLLTEDPVVARAHKVIYPTSATYGDQMLKKYMDIYAIQYTIPEHSIRKIKTKMYGSNSYSHTAFENSILKDKRLLQDYMSIVVRTIEDYYVPDYKPKDKLIIFVARIAMADYFVKILTDLYPEKNVVRYCEDDSYDEMLKGDFIVTTVLSAGTGLDIPNLRVGIQTVCISSPVSNIQSAGRLRKLKDRDVKFCYLYCGNIPKHRQYHMKRKEIFRDRAAHYVDRRSAVNFK